MVGEERFQQVKEKEITQLTTPMSYPKLGWFTFRVTHRDCEGNPVPIIKGLRNKNVLEPKPEILSGDEDWFICYHEGFDFGLK